ncbi:MlaD family protein [Sphingomonas bacterium]|uniref:MlaD family protein n=1 Tax=Sphingomonas bacterium TaxID=1895847 RepID=UPI001575BF81|nr:MlaD family protein [Sphingomonas bacterium]
MERHANYALVGVLTTVLILGGLVFAIWLGGIQSAGKHDHYRIVFKGPVRGLTDGGEVQFNGIKSGAIEKVFLSPQNSLLVIADIALERGTPVRADSLASSEMQGISGVNVVQITAGTPAKPLLKGASDDDRPIIRSKPDQMASLLEGGGRAVQQATELLDRANRVLSDRNIATLDAAMRDLHAVTAEFAAHRAMIGDAAAALAKLDAAATDIQATSASARGLVDGDGRQAVTDVAAAAKELKAAVQEARGVIRQFGGQSGAFGSTITATMMSVQETAESLDGLIRQIRQDPHGTLGKPRGKELELPK